MKCFWAHDVCCHFFESRIFILVFSLIFNMFSSLLYNRQMSVSFPPIDGVICWGLVIWYLYNTSEIAKCVDSFLLFAMKPLKFTFWKYALCTMHFAFLHIFVNQNVWVHNVLYRGWIHTVGKEYSFNSQKTFCHLYSFGLKIPSEIFFITSAFILSFFINKWQFYKKFDSFLEF